MVPARARENKRADLVPSFHWPAHGLRQPDPVSHEELRKLEIYCFANCATDMVPVEDPGGGKITAPWIESYGNEKDLVARLGVLAAESGAGSVHIGGSKYVAEGAWGHLLNAHYLFPMMSSRETGDPAGGLTPMHKTRAPVPRLFAYLKGESPLPRGVRTSKTRVPDEQYMAGKAVGHC